MRTSGKTPATVLTNGARKGKSTTMGTYTLPDAPAQDTRIQMLVRALRKDLKLLEDERGYCGKDREAFPCSTAQREEGAPWRRGLRLTFGCSHRQ
jgi:hypothetical protein